jgi:hypothetical protein
MIALEPGQKRLVYARPTIFFAPESQVLQWQVAHPAAKPDRLPACSACRKAVVHNMKW